MNKFITENDTGPEAPWVLLCGPTCIGKTYFREVQNFYRVPFRSQSPAANSVLEQLEKLSLYHYNVVTTSDLELWTTKWYTEEYKIKKRAIILGVPLFVWRERLRIRGNPELPEGFIDRYNLKYKRWVIKLKKYNIPYIFVDSRNDYPILDESSFFTMLTSNE